MNSLQASAPPLIRVKRVPFWLVCRDLLLTAIAWIAIAQSVRQCFYLFYDYFTPPFFRLTHSSAPRLLHIWNPLRIFLLIAACCVAWLGFWALVNTKRFKKTHVAAQPAALEISEHANHLGLNQEEIERWRTYRIAVVHFDPDSRITDVSQYDLAFAKAAATGRT